MEYLGLFFFKECGLIFLCFRFSCHWFNSSDPAWFIALGMFLNFLHEFFFTTCFFQVHLFTCIIYWREWLLVNTHIHLACSNSIGTGNLVSCVVIDTEVPQDKSPLSWYNCPHPFLGSSPFTGSPGNNIDPICITMKEDSRFTVIPGSFLDFHRGETLPWAFHIYGWTRIQLLQ